MKTKLLIVAVVLMFFGAGAYSGIVWFRGDFDPADEVSELEDFLGRVRLLEERLAGGVLVVADLDQLRSHSFIKTLERRLETYEDDYHSNNALNDLYRLGHSIGLLKAESVFTRAEAKRSVKNSLISLQSNSFTEDGLKRDELLMSVLGTIMILFFMVIIVGGCAR